ncbi:MAG TPA: hypothetical protein VGO60_14750, partial [Iamia sp.]|nr:hypothetical protein [Iamia sp.]
MSITEASPAPDTGRSFGVEWGALDRAEIQARLTDIPALTGDIPALSLAYLGAEPGGERYVLVLEAGVEDPLQQWVGTHRGWLGFALMIARVVDTTGRHDAGEATADDLRATFADDEVEEVVRHYYSFARLGLWPDAPGTEGSDGDLPGADPWARGITARAPLSARFQRMNLAVTPLRLRVHDFGSTSFVLRADAVDQGGNTQPLAVKCVVPPYLRWPDVREANVTYRLQFGEPGRGEAEDNTTTTWPVPWVYLASESLIVSAFVR